MNEEKIQRVEQARRAKLIKTITTWGIVAAVVIGGGFGFLKYLKYRDATLPGISYPDEGRDHIEIGQQHDAYDTNPPTSGPHNASPAPWGVYRDPLPDEQLIHNLEHGGVWISYKPGIPKEIVTELESFFKKYGSKVIITPREANDADIALAVWTRSEKFSVAEYSPERVDNFIRRLRNKTGPEPFAP